MTASNCRYAIRALLGDVPSWRTWLPVLVVILAVLTLLGVLAEVLHRTQGTHWSYLPKLVKLTAPRSGSR